MYHNCQNCLVNFQREVAASTRVENVVLLRKILRTSWQDAVYFSEIKARQVCFAELLCS